MKQYLGFDVGGTSIKVGVVEENARVVYHEKLPIPPDYDAFMEQLSDCYHRLKKEYPTLCGIGISSCGGINPATGVVFAKLAPSLTYLIGREYYKLREMVDVPVALEKDGNCAALGEIWCGSATDLQNFITLVLGSGFGGAVCVGGKVFTGAHFLAGDMGYAYPLPEDTSYGQYIAPVEVEKRYRELTGGFKTIPEMKQTQDDDPAAKDCYLRFIDGLANALLTMQYVMDPEMFLLGGGITSWPELIPELEAHIAALVQRRDGPLVPRVRACTHQNDANLLGAVYNLKQTFGL